MGAVAALSDTLSNKCVRTVRGVDTGCRCRAAKEELGFLVTD